MRQEQLIAEVHKLKYTLGLHFFC